MHSDISVIVPAYNCETFLKRALASAARQTLPPAEILVVDDCSTDRTRAVVEAAAQADHRIRLIAMPSNGGPSAARNAGLAAATGNWLAILDADDAFVPERLEQLVRFGAETGADIVADDLFYFDAAAGRATGRGIGAGEAPMLGPIDLREYVAHNLATGESFDWGLLKPIFRRETLNRLGISYELTLRHGEDFKLMADLLCAGARFHILNQPLYLYTQRQGAVSGRLSGMTRTSIGYDRLRDASLALAEDPRISADPKLVSLLRQRARGLGRFDDAHFFSTAVRARAFGAIFNRLRHNPRFLPLMMRQLWLACQRRLRHLGPSKTRARPS